MQCVGKGLILLLHGAPGVGKTSTAGEYVESDPSSSCAGSQALQWRDNKLCTDKDFEQRAWLNFSRGHYFRSHAVREAQHQTWGFKIGDRVDANINKSQAISVRLHWRSKGLSRQTLPSQADGAVSFYLTRPTSSSPREPRKTLSATDWSPVCGYLLGSTENLSHF